MNIVLKVAIVYGLLLLVFRIAGKRSLADITPFDLLLTIVMGDIIQQAIVGEDHSLVGAAVIVITLVGMDILLSVLKHRFEKLGKILDGIPSIIVRNGKIDQRVADKERIDLEDILAAARRVQGVGRLDRIGVAVIEESGGISIIPVSSVKDG